MTTAVVVKAVDTTAIEQRLAVLAKRADAFIVDSADALQQCEQFVLDIDADIKEVEAELNPGIAKANDTHKHLTQQRKKFLDPRKAAKATAKSKCATYRRQEEEKRRKEEDRLRVIALKEAEDQRLAEAEQLAKAGHEEAADEVLEQPVVAAPVVLPPAAPPKPAGMYRKAWKARIDHPGMVPRRWCMPDQIALNAQARQLEEAAVGTVRGVTFHNAGL